MKTMIFAAGLGTRLKPLTDSMPKAMVPVGGKPLIDHILNKMQKAGASEIVVNVHHFSEQIIDYIRQHSWEVPVRISDETEELLDTGGGLYHASGLFTQDERPILIHNVDILSNADLAGFYRNHEGIGADVQLLVSNRKTSRYLLFDDAMRLMGWTNVNTHEVRSPYPDLDLDQLHAYAFSGIHTFSPHLFERMQSFPKKFPIMDFYLSNCDKIKIYGNLQPDLRMLDVGKLNTLEEAQKWVANHPE